MAIHPLVATKVQYRLPMNTIALAYQGRSATHRLVLWASQELRIGRQAVDTHDGPVTWIQIVEVAAIGAAVGFLGGLFGKGGSAIATPLLVVLAGLPAFVAVASPLPSAIPGTLIASFAYWRERLVDWNVVRWSIGVGVPATALGAYATRWIEGGSLVIGTEVIVALLGVRFLLRVGDHDEVQTTARASRARLVSVALVVGLLSGLLANGGGFLLAPLFVLVLRLPIKQAFASSLAVAAALAVPGTIVHAALGHIDWTVVGIFGIASTPLSYAGARVAVRTHAARLERLYGAGLLIIGLTTLILG
jgi:uncharacterized protein